MLAGFAVGFKVIGTQFLPNLDEGNIYIRVTFPYSISLSKTHENAKKVRDILVAASGDKDGRCPCGKAGGRDGRYGPL